MTKYTDIEFSFQTHSRHVRCDGQDSGLIEGPKEVLLVSVLWLASTRLSSIHQLKKVRVSPHIFISPVARPNEIKIMDLLCLVCLVLANAGHPVSELQHQICYEQFQMLNHIQTPSSPTITNPPPPLVCVRRSCLSIIPIVFVQI